MKVEQELDGVAEEATLELGLEQGQLAELLMANGTMGEAGQVGLTCRGEFLDFRT
jgi:hypothetical protein